jgi:hypothetical protein
MMSPQTRAGLPENTLERRRGNVLDGNDIGRIG